MPEAARSPFAAWESFYVIMGSSAAALTGLQFVVMALVTEVRREGSSKEIDAFATPTIVHFCTVLLLSAILSAPWPSSSLAADALGLCGAAGLVYGALVVGRVRQQMAYQPVMEDWIWHIVLPLVAYVVLLAAAIAFRSYPVASLFLVGATALLLLFIGIHNAWDTATYIALERLQSRDTPAKSD